MIIVIGCHTIKWKHKNQNAVEKLQSLSCGGETEPHQSKHTTSVRPWLCSGTPPQPRARWLLPSSANLISIGYSPQAQSLVDEVRAEDKYDIHQERNEK